MENEKVVWGCVEYKTIWEAEYAVDFPVLVPSVLGTEYIQRIAVISEKLVNIEYTNGIVYRTSMGTDDISGDYNKYIEENKFDAGENIVYHVTARGANKRVFLAIWTDDTYSYSIQIPHGVSQDNLEELIKSLTQVNGCKTMDNACEANPLVEYDYIFEAEYAVGFSIAVPTVLGADKIKHIYVISNKVVELVFKNKIIYRTARGNEDISGIYTTYPYAETFDAGEFHVTAKGNRDLYYVSVWTGYGMTWSLYCPHGIHKKSLLQLIGSLRQTNSDSFKADDCLSCNTAVGAYTAYHTVTEDEKALFYEAVRLVGVSYEPLLAATQLVAGTNYRFICNARTVTLNSIPYLAQVTVFVPLSNGEPKKPECINIKRLD